jgi:hypothetical protein
MDKPRKFLRRNRIMIYCPDIKKYDRACQEERNNASANVGATARKETTREDINGREAISMDLMTIRDTRRKDRAGVFALAAAITLSLSAPCAETMPRYRARLPG